MTRTLTLLMVALTCLGTAPVTAHAPQNRSSDGYSRHEADVIGARLFRAIVGRDGGPTGPGDAASQILGGHLGAQVDAMFSSPEFRQKSAKMPPLQILDQIYQGLLDRKADDGGVHAYLHEVEQRQYASVVMKIINSPEFETRMLGRPDPSIRSNPPERFNPPDRANPPDRFSQPDRPMRSGWPDWPAGNRPGSMRAVEECQVDVLEQVRSDVAGPVLLRFQEPDRSSGGRGPDIIRGVAVDMLDRDHRLSYRCEVDGNRATPSRVAYDFDDGRTRRQSQPAWEFPLASVQTCQDAVRQQVSRDRGRHDTVFESAGVSQWAGSLERVFGLGHERSVGGLTFEYRCDIQRGRVASADFLPIR